MAENIFRKSALEKLSSPEKLDQLITIISPKAWILLSSIGLSLAAGIGWGFMGKTKTKVQAQGILLSGEVRNIVSTSFGQLIELKVGVDDEIEVGQIVAIVDQPELESEIQEAEASLEEHLLQLRQLKSFGNQDTRVQDQIANEQSVNLNEEIKINLGQITFLDQQLIKEENLLEKGLITESQVEQTRQQIIGLQSDIKSLEARITQVASQKLTSEFDYSQKVTSLNQRIDQTRRKVSQLKEQLLLKSNVTSRHSGKILELMTDEGLMLQPGSPIYKLGPMAQAQEEMRAILYLSSSDGKKVLENMEALIAPATVKPQEFGYMKGKVTFVSEFPATPEGMLHILKNEELVRQMLALGAPFEVHVDLEKSPESSNGYAWTSRGGPPVDIFPGTPCTAQLTVKEQSPITIVIPAFKDFFNLY